MSNFEDILIWPTAANISFYFGLYGILREPGKNHEKRIKFYKLSQGVLVAMWFLFTIISSGSHAGWTRFSDFSKCSELNQGSFGFCKLLALVEITMYYSSCFLGSFCLYALNTDPKILAHPFEEPEKGVELEGRARQYEDPDAQP